MTITEVRKTAVLGAGLMGHGTRQAATQDGGHEVNVRDIEQRFLDKGMAMIKKSLRKFQSEGYSADVVLDSNP